MALTTDFSGSSLPSGWTFESNLAGGTHSVADGRLTLTATTTTNYDSVFPTGANDNSIGVRHAVSAGDLDVAIQIDSDIGDKKSAGINLLFSDGAGGWARWAIYHGNSNTEFPSFYSVSRPTGGGGGTQHLNSSTQTQSIMSGMPAWMRLSYNSGTGLWSAMFSTDGFNWVTVVTFTRLFTPTYFKIGFTSTTGAAAGNAVEVSQCIDLTTNGGVTDLRAGMPTRVRIPAVTLDGSAGVLPAEFVDDSAGATSGLSWTGSALRFSDDALLNANGAGWARIRYTGTEYSECGLLMRLSNPVGNSSCYGTVGLLHGLPNPATITSSGASRTSNVVTATVTSGHGLRQGNIINASYTDTSFDGTFILTSVAATTVTWAQTDVDASAGTGTVVRPTPIDQYVRGPGYGLEIQSGPIRRPIRIDDPNDSNVSSVPGSTALNEMPYFHMKNLTGQYNMTDGGIRMFRLERIGMRFRVKEWADAGSLAASLAVEPATWDYIDGQDEVIRTTFGPAFSLSHNGTQGTPTCTMDLYYLQFYEISTAVKAKSGGVMTDAETIRVKSGGEWIDAATVKRKSGGTWLG